MKSLNGLRLLQIFLAILALLGNFIIIDKLFGNHKGSTGCEAFLIAYLSQIIGFVITFYISKQLYKNTKSFKELSIYVPFLYLIAFLILYIGYQLNYINIYDPSMRGFEKGEGCFGNVLIKILSKRIL